MLGVALCNVYTNAWTDDPDAALSRALERAERAVSLDDSLSQAHWVLGLAFMWSRQHDLASRELARAIELDPSFAHAYAALGVLCGYDHRPDDAYDSLEMAMHLHPHYPDIFLHFLGLAYFVAGRYEAAADALSRRVSRRPDTDISRVLLASSYGHLGRKKEAQAQWGEALRLNPSYSLEQKRSALPFRDPADFERIVEGLRLAGAVE